MLGFETALNCPGFVTRLRPNGAALCQPRATPWVVVGPRLQSPNGAVLADYGESFAESPRWGSCRNLRNETPGDAWGYLRTAPLGVGQNENQRRNLRLNPQVLAAQRRTDRPYKSGLRSCRLDRFDQRLRRIV